MNRPDISDARINSLSLSEALKACELLAKASDMPGAEFAGKAYRQASDDQAATPDEVDDLKILDISNERINSLTLSETLQACELFEKASEMLGAEFVRNPYRQASRDQAEPDSEKGDDVNELKILDISDARLNSLTLSETLQACDIFEKAARMQTEEFARNPYRQASGHPGEQPSPYQSSPDSDKCDEAPRVRDE